ncbi:hypothetical protein DL770_008276 [Monosporascus sp. CRB-9-2]|nr:hypothetical protein DL770_008276 [Monosporascus sp. CRB-9-2]
MMVGSVAPGVRQTGTLIGLRTPHLNAGLAFLRVHPALTVVRESDLHVLVTVSDELFEAVPFITRVFTHQQLQILTRDFLERRSDQPRQHLPEGQRRVRHDDRVDLVEKPGRVLGPALQSHIAFRVSRSTSSSASSYA